MALDEDIHKEMGKEMGITQETELGSVMKNLDEDVIDKLTKMSKIDFNTRLTQEQINACLVFDELKVMGILPEDCALTTRVKRLSISRDGLGRKEKVQIVIGDREQKQGIGFGERLGNLFKRKE